MWFSQLLTSQNYRTQFLELCQTRDTLKQKEVLESWTKSNPKDPELFTSYFNYHFVKAKKELVVLSEDEPNGEGLVLKESGGTIVGFMGSQLYYDQTEIEKAMVKIDRGIELYPNRLDMRFGKIYALGELEDWQAFTDEIINTIRYSAINNNEWLWTNNQPEIGEDILLSSIQRYQNQIYVVENDDLLIHIKEIATEILTYYPDHLESLSNTSVVFMVNKEYDEALKYMFQAHTLNPKDTIVLGNIAHVYYLKGDNKTAIEYYERIIEYGDARAKSYAEGQIEALKK